MPVGVIQIYDTGAYMFRRELTNVGLESQKL